MHPPSLKLAVCRCAENEWIGTARSMDVQYLDTHIATLQYNTGITPGIMQFQAYADWRNMHRHNPISGSIVQHQVASLGGIHTKRCRKLCLGGIHIDLGLGIVPLNINESVPCGINNPHRSQQCGCNVFLSDALFTA